jgi:hypothetical protein
MYSSRAIKHKDKGTVYERNEGRGKVKVKVKSVCGSFSTYA